ncbi:MAG TPA: c-type cytochrome, partial [Xanthomonadales bacterium]|nr:c-type cytochrome [Xanthomonadales bacterium]
EAPKLKPGRFWPEQLFMDTVLSFAMFVLIVALSWFSPAPLDAKADPNVDAFVPYPAWYFLALYALLDIVGKFPAQIVQISTLVATIVGPTLLVVLLLVLPFVDRNPSRRLSRRPWVLGGTALVMLGAIALSFIGQANVVEQQLAKNLIGPNAPVAAAATSNGTLQAGPAGTSTSGSTAKGTTPVSAGNGASVYSTNCIGCHGDKGQGVAGQFPPLAGNPFVTGDPKPVIGVLLKGLNGKVDVNGQSYNQVMPPWKGTLTNAQIADVITYIRNAWGNKASTVTEAQVAAGGK